MSDASFFQCYISESDCPKDAGKNYYNKDLKKCWKN